MSKIVASVGRGGKNLPADVKLIQKLLNIVKITGFQTPLKVDGKAGKNTIARIEAFQKTKVKLAHPDGRIDPHRRTFLTLVKLTSSKTESNVHSFIGQAIHAAQVSEVRTGVPASITIAQAILESGWGKYHMGSANNYFGIKAQTSHGQITYGDVANGYVDKVTKEHIKKLNKDISITAHFRSYKNMTDSFVDHGLFLKNNARYRTALANYAKTKDADDFAKGLQRAGYATDPHYANKLINIMKKNHLYKYNQPNLLTRVSVWIDEELKSLASLGSK